ncbi:MAG: hypothetical protein CL609_20840 [Anaerolineaceae bacterium]|nr:hypothetical protein [Anaerolineaceae bacterium]
MRKTYLNLFFVLLSLLIVFSACQPNLPARVEAPEPTAYEMPVTLLTLAAPLNTPKAEISGLSWAGDWLIFLPQYPGRFNNQLFRISKDTLLQAIQTNSSEPLPMLPITLDSAGLEKSIPGFEGFEAIAVENNTVYLTIEAKQGEMMGYIVSGILNETMDQIALDADSLTELEPQAKLDNMSDESIVVFGRRVITFYEANGFNVNADPSAYSLDLDLHPMDRLSFPTIEYRVTDASNVDTNGLFWVINYFYPGDKKLKPAEDFFSQTYGKGYTHNQNTTVERLIPLQFTEDGIVPVQKAPIQLELLPDDEARNWEGLVTLDDLGFLIVTDEFPETLFGFVAFPEFYEPIR